MQWLVTRLIGLGVGLAVTGVAIGLFALWANHLPKRAPRQPQEVVISLKASSSKHAP